MSAAGSLVGRKRERLAQSPGQKGPTVQKGASKALERLAAAHTACSRILASQTYPDSLSELARTLQQVFGAKVVVLFDRTAVSGAIGAAPAHKETHTWLESLGQQHLEGRESSISTFDLEASDATPPISGVRRFVVVPISAGRGHGALWLGFGDHGPSSPEELTCLSVLGEHLSLAVQRATAQPSTLPRSNAADELIPLAAHELRTPLTPITMLLQSLERKARAGTVDVDTILRTRKQVSRLTHMISDLLDLSRLREQRLVLTPVRCDLGKIVREAIDSFHEVDPRHRVELTGETTMIEVTTDESRLKHTLSSLLDHVAHATPPGGLIEVILQRRDPSVAITIRADRPVFGGDIPQSSEVVGPSHARPEAIALGVLLAQGVTTRQGGTVSLAPSRTNETRAEVTLPLSTADELG
jgi:K+-sensing histidine kinase KdpD